ncbi:BCCT family transporter [Deltaproteobacteria bacterium OttesenSCG-928-M10]|nr:BCCT family transporter [Deltaproteobacteria bacterium OttesenSCG-928-M10]
MFNQVNKPVTFITLALLLAAVLPLMFMSAQISATISWLFGILTSDYAWFFLLFGIMSFVSALIFAFTRYGDIRIGGPDAQPHYSRFSWISMNLCACLASGILVFGTVEWMYYVTGTPHEIEPYSTRAYEYAAAYGLFHWGFSAWAIYLPPSIAIAYMYWNRKAASLRVSDSCTGLLGEDPNQNKGLKIIIDGLVTFFFIASLMTTIGLGSPLIAELASSMLGIENTFTIKLTVIFLFCLAFILAASKTISKGMAVISRFNVWLGLGLFAYIFIVGPKAFILNTAVQAVGLNIQEFVTFNTYTDFAANTGFVQGWTIFYWAWYVSLAIVTALWVARVSYGRTFREVTFALVVASPLACWLSFSILGNYGMYQELSGVIKLSEVISQGNNAGTLAMLKTLPLSGLVIVVFIVLLFFNLATTCTANSTIVAMLTSQGVKEDEEPNTWYKVFWGVIFLLLPVGILILERQVPGVKILGTLQSVTGVISIPMFFILMMLYYSVYKSVKQDIDNGTVSIDPKRRYRWPELNKDKG